MKASTKIMGLSARRFLILNLLFALVLATSAWGGSQPDPLINELSKLSGGKVHVSCHSGTGKVLLLRAEPGAAIPQPFALPRDATPELAARSFLGKYGILFGIVDPSKELAVKREKKADRGRSFVRFQQMHQGIPVIGGELIVQMDSKKDVLSVNGKLSSAPAVPISAGFPSESAKEKALEMVGATYQIDNVLLKVSEPELWIYNPALLGKRPNLNTLVWRMEVKPTETRPIRELVLVDAVSGEIVLHFNQIDSALNRKIYDHDNTYGKPLPGGSGDLKRSEGQSPSGITDVDLAYDYAGDTYNFYSTYHGRDSLDNAGMDLISTTRFCPDFFNCPYQNAFWYSGDGIQSQMVYGEGFASADDVVAHEMTHGVTEHESNLIYYNQSGAINESFSDIWGEFVDLTNGRGNDAPSVRWKIGEDFPLEIGVIRDMSDPTVFGDPDRMLSSNYWNHQCDNGGVHINSGIGNKAAYLMTDGDSFNGKTVAGIGISKVAKIFYEAQTNLLTTSSDYNDLADALQQACTNLTGTNGITASDCQEVVNAIIATEMNQTPPANVLNNPGFEEGRANWTEYSSPPYDIIAQDPSLAFCYSNWYAGLGGYNNVTQYVYQDVSIPSNATQAYLRFAYFIFTTEGDGVIYDTMKVEIRRPSDNALLTTLVTLSNLDDTAFYYYFSDKYDLSSYKGQTIRLQIYANTDPSLETFFIVDDIVLAVLVPAGPPQTETISTPNTPSGPLTGVVQTSYSFTTGGSSSNLGDLVQYLFDWGDGTNSGWLPIGMTSAAHTWASAGTYLVRAQARCTTHPSVLSGWSGTVSITIFVLQWERVPRVIIDSPSLVWNPTASKLQMVVRGGGNSIWAASFSSVGVFNNDWQNIPGTIISSPALAWNPVAQKMQMVVRGGGDSIWAGTFDSSGAFNNDWVQIPGAIFDPPALAWNDVAGKMQMVVRGGGNTIWAATFSNSGPNISFDGNWTQIPGAILSAPALAWIPAPTNKMWMLVQGGGNTIWKASFSTSESTISFDGNWTQIPGAILSAPALAWNDVAGKIQMVVRGGGDSIWAATFNSNGTFNSDWTHIPGGTPSSPGMVYLPSGYVCIVVRGLDNSIWRTLY